MRIGYACKACDVPMPQTFGPHLLTTFTVLTEDMEVSAMALASAAAWARADHQAAGCIRGGLLLEGYAA
jgi:hypothetical protein